MHRLNFWIMAVTCTFSLSALAQQKATNFGNVTSMQQPTQPEAPENDLNTKRFQFGAGVGTAQFKYSEAKMTEKVDDMTDLEAYAVFPIKTRMQVTGELGFLSGSGGYDGQTQDGAPIKSGSDTSVSNLRGLFGWRLFTNEDQTSRILPYAGLGLRNLKNTIQGDGGYRREVDYLYLPMGTEFAWETSNRWTFSIRPELRLLLLGTVTSYLSDANPDLPDVTNYQSSGAGFQISGSVRKQFQHFGIALQAYFEQWHVDDSDTQTTAFNSGGTEYELKTVEPSNDTQTVGINALVTF